MTYPSEGLYPSESLYPSDGGGTPPPIVVGYVAESIVKYSPDKTYRIIVQDILSRKFIDWDLPVSDVQITYTLSGPNLLKGRLAPEIQDFIDLNLEPKATYIHVEQDNIIRASFILQPGEIAADGSISFIGEGYTGYAHGQPFQGVYFKNDIDPLDVVRDIWSYLLSTPRSNLGVQVSGTISPVRVGNAVDLSNDSITPYHLFWWDNPDCGQAIDALAKSTPFDYYESSYWLDKTHTDVGHLIQLAYPRAGNRQFNLAFVTGENIISIVLLREEPDQYASEVVVIGAGAGADSIRGFAANIIGSRLRQAKAITDKTIITVDDANKRAEAELRNAQAFLQIRQIVIQDNHANASLGDFYVGDDILIDADVYWFGSFRMWCRILSYDWNPALRTITINLANSDQFNYGPPPPIFAP